MFNILRENKLYCNWKKCTFAQDKIKYLGFIIHNNKVIPDHEKIKAIVEWPMPLTSVREVRAFLGLASYLRRHIRDFSKIAAPLHDFVKAQRVVWTPLAQLSVDTLKQALTNAPALTLPRFDKPFVIYTDASDTAIGAILLQVDDDNKHHNVIAYESHKLDTAQRNYCTTDKELFAIVYAVHKWHTYIVASSVIIYTDHAPLTHLKSLVKPAARHMRWLMTLSQLNMQIVYKPGKFNVAADALSRMPHVTCSVLSVTQIPDQFLHLIRDGYKKDKLYMYWLNQPREGYTWRDDLLYKRTIKKCLPVCTSENDNTLSETVNDVSETDIHNTCLNDTSDKKRFHDIDMDQDMSVDVPSEPPARANAKLYDNVELCEVLCIPYVLIVRDIILSESHASKYAA